MDHKTLMFGVKRAKTGEDSEPQRPRWRHVEVENTDCPESPEHHMVVILGHESILYGYCFECNRYYLAE